LLYGEAPAKTPHQRPRHKLLRKKAVSRATNFLEMARPSDRPDTTV
jgi:hypothetical protein